MMPALLKAHGNKARVLTIILLVCSGFLSMWAGILSPPRSMPDERHHISYAMYVYQHPGDFPPHLENIYTEPHRDYNHIKHPPLYYYYLAAAIAVSEYDADFTAVGRDWDEHGSPQTARVLARVLRLFSWLLMAVGLLGVAVLLRSLERHNLLNPWLSLAFVVMTCFIPGLIFIAGAVNNDVMVLALWPWLALAFVRYVLNGESRDFYFGVVLTGLLVLTKSTAWLLALIFATGFVIKLHRLGIRSLNLKTLWLLPTITVVLLVGIFLSSNLIRYGKLQPTYLEVHNLERHESKFWSLPDDAEMPQISWSYTLERCNFFLMRGTTGVLSHNDLIEKPRLHQLAWLALLALVLLTAASLFGLRNEGCQRWFLLWLLSLPAQYLLLLIFNHHIYPRYLVHAFEGRYLIGSIHTSLLAMLIGVNTFHTGISRRWRGIQITLFALGFLIWCWVFVDPMLFNRHTSAYLRDTKMVQIVKGQVGETGFSEIKDAPGLPKMQRRFGVPRHYPLVDGAQFLLYVGQGTLKVYVEAIHDDSTLIVQTKGETQTFSISQDAQLLDIEVVGPTQFTAKGNLRIYAIWQR